MSKFRSLLILLGLCGAVGLLLIPSFTGRATTLDGPNLSVREDVLGSQWVVREEKISATACSAIEGEVTPGLRTLVRFTVMTPNTGNQDIFVGDPNDHVAAGDGLFEFASCHNHYHFRHYALYELVDPSTGKVWRAAKRGFCMLDTDPFNVGTGDGVVQNAGQSSANQIRTAPLWGIRARNRLMHEGLNITIFDSIQLHAGQATAARNAFNSLTAAQRNDLIAFVLSL